MAETIWSELAQEELDRLYNPLHDEIIECVEMIELFPESGTKVDANGSARKFPCRPYWIIYSVLDDGAVYIRFLHHMKRGSLPS